MASGRGFLGLVACLLLLQSKLWEAWAAASVLSTSGLPSGHSEAPRDNPPPPPTLESMSMVAYQGGSSPFVSITLVCGQPLMKILGGQESEEGKWPWQVSVRIRHMHICGGSLISAQWVLTAAHCIFSQIQYNVKMGDRSVYRQNTSVVIPIKNIIVHPKFSTAIVIENDIALLKLQYPVNFTSNIHPICLPSETFYVKTGTSCWVTGWGRTDVGAPKIPTAILREVEQNIIHYHDCNAMLKKGVGTSKEMVKSGMICGYKEGRKDSCQGDSGGPLSCQFNDKWVQVGIVSWGISCGRKNFPGVYTDVGAYSKWLVAVVNQATCFQPVAFLILPLRLLLL
ncbi:serine protease 42-like [Psammomys obesus]|uniref:serine protease 42-like n=1 Tax=Psammomys obesus TaxID=48139 RepID=UPI0024530D42|nr:serine protease 42-like [Psammomys obesus]